MLLKIYPENPNLKIIRKVVEHLKEGRIIIFPTDTIYAIGCDIYRQKAVEKICRIKNVKIEKCNFSFICYDLSHISDFTRQVDTSTYKLMKKALPGPYTFILNANNSIPKIFKNKKKTIGIRVPDNPIARLLIKELGNPIMSTSIHDNDEIIEYTTDPGLIFEKYRNLVDIVIDGGYGDNKASTVIDCTGDEPIPLREGKGDINNLELPIIQHNSF